jgi:hypothetical protein
VNHCLGDKNKPLLDIRPEEKGDVLDSKIPMITLISTNHAVTERPQTMKNDPENKVEVQKPALANMLRLRWSIGPHLAKGCIRGVDASKRMKPTIEEAKRLLRMRGIKVRVRCGCCSIPTYTIPSSFIRHHQYLPVPPVTVPASQTEPVAMAFHSEARHPSGRPCLWSLAWKKDGQADMRLAI